MRDEIPCHKQCNQPHKHIVIEQKPIPTPMKISPVIEVISKV